MSKALKTLSVICGMLLFIAALRLPIGYYTFLRIAVTIMAVMLLVHHSQNGGLSIWTILFGVIAILFNPILPIYLHSKSAWIPIDVVAGLVFVADVLMRSRPTSLRAKSV